MNMTRTLIVLLAVTAGLFAPNMTGTDEAILNPSFAYYIDTDDFAGAQWMEFGVSHDFAFSDMAGVKETFLKDVTISPSLVLGIDHRFTESSTKLGNLLYGLAIAYDINGALDIPDTYGSMSVTGFINYSQALARRGNHLLRQIATARRCGPERPFKEQVHLENIPGHPKDAGSRICPHPSRMYSEPPIGFVPEPRSRARGRLDQSRRRGRRRDRSPRRRIGCLPASVLLTPAWGPKNGRLRTAPEVSVQRERHGRSRGPHRTKSIRPPSQPRAGVRLPMLTLGREQPIFQHRERGTLNPPT